jgi:hypothetical protein
MESLKYTESRQMSHRFVTSILLPAAFQLFDPSQAALATPPTITGQPRNCASCNGLAPAGFGCGASGTHPLNFQWRRGTTNITNGANIAGATSGTLYIWPPILSDAASDYNCVVSNAEGTAVSNNATLAVWPTGTGDVNGDGIVDGRDLQAFVNVCLSLPPLEGARTLSYCAVDMDGNGYLGCEDVCLFAQVLLQSPLGCGVTPTNDDCPNAILLSTGIVYSGDTAFATRDGPHITCEYNCEPACGTAPDVWFKWVADFTGTADFSMCDTMQVDQYDSVMAIYSACPSMGGAELACGDDTYCQNLQSIVSEACIQATAGQTYWISITGWAGNKGCFSLRVAPGCN